MQIAAQRGPDLAATEIFCRRAQFDQDIGFAAGPGLGDHLRGLRPDPRQRLPAVGLAVLLALRVGQRLDDVGGVAVGHHPSRVLARAVLVVRDLTQRDGSRAPWTPVCHSASRTTRRHSAIRLQNLTAEHHLGRHAAVWQTADDIDVYESGWTFDHFYPIFSDSTGPCLEGWTTLTALAQATKRLRVGVLVTGIHYRHPAVLANMASALDIVSNGRLELGIGAGWNEEESGAYGIELGTIKERFDRFEEACEVLTGLLSQETTSFDGKYYQLKDARNEPKGPQQPHPPICIGGSGEKRTLPITARYADHWNFVGGPPEEFAHKRDVLAAHCADIGRDPKEISCRRISGWARTATTNRWSTTRPRWARRDSIWRSSICRRRTTPPCWNRWPRRSGIRGCSPRPEGHKLITAWQRKDCGAGYVPRGDAAVASSRSAGAPPRSPGARAWREIRGSSPDAETMTRRFFPSATRYRVDVHGDHSCGLRLLDRALTLPQCPVLNIRYRRMGKPEKARRGNI